MKLLGNWKFKVAIQFILAHIYFGEYLNYCLQRINGINNKQKILRGITNKYIPTLLDLNKVKDLKGAIVFEIGTGWIPIFPILFYLIGAKKVYTYDHERHLRLSSIHALLDTFCSYLSDIAKAIGISKEEINDKLNALKKFKTINEFFSACNIEYFAPSDAGKSLHENNSIDVVFSFEVLEHVSPKNLVDICQESKRILKRDGIGFHAIGLHDHYNGFDNSVSKVNFLKYSEKFWATFVKNKISYHNRLREVDFFRAFENDGGEIVWSDHIIDTSDLDALKNMKVDEIFSGMTDEELAVSYTKVAYKYES
jgi:SAM-dependent methyltransferase